MVFVVLTVVAVVLGLPALAFFARPVLEAEQIAGGAPATLVKPYLPHYFVRQSQLGFDVVQVGTGVIVKQTLSEALAQELVKVYTEIDKKGV